MSLKKILSLGWITAAAFILGSIILGSILKDYSMIAQTVSEIGEKGSPLFLTWQIFSIAIGGLFLLFSFGTIAFAKRHNFSSLPGIFLLSYGLSQLGIGLFPAPHPLHNIFGLSMTLGYFSPLVFSLSWKNGLGSAFKWISILAFLIIVLGIFLNLAPAFAPTRYPQEHYGLVQRFLLFTFYLYCGYVGYRTTKYPILP